MTVCVSLCREKINNVKPPNFWFFLSKPIIKVEEMVKRRVEAR